MPMPQLILKKVPEATTVIPESYINIGFTHNEKGDYKKAKECYLYALGLLDKIKENYPIQANQAIATSFNNLAKVYFHTKDYENALHYLLKVQNLLPLNSPYQAHVSLQTASAYIGQKQYEKALMQLKKAKALVFAKWKNQHPILCYLYNSFSSVYFETGRWQTAMEYSNKGLKIAQKNLGKHHSITGTAWSSIASCQTKMGYYSDALHSLSQALVAFFPAFLPENALQNPKVEDFLPSTHLFSMLKQKCGTLHRIHEQGLDDKNHQHLRACVDTFGTTVKAIDVIRSSYKAEASKLYLAESTGEIFEIGFAATYQLYQLTHERNILEKLFLFGEKRKGVLSLSQLKETEARLKANIPSKLLDKEYDLRKDILFYDKQLLEGKTKDGKPQNPAVLKKWQNERIEAKQQYDILIEQLEKNHPDYYRLKYDTKTASVVQIQSALENDQALISYFTGEKDLYVFAIGKENFEVFKVNKAEYEEDLKRLLGLFNGDGLFRKPRFIKSATKLYQCLLAKALEAIQASKLVLIPDGELLQLPFETLLIGEVEDEAKLLDLPFNELPYLIRKYEISYHFSATLWHYQISDGTKKPFPSQKPHFVGFAPVYQGKDEAVLTRSKARAVTLRGNDCYELPFSKKEVEDIAGLFAAQQYESSSFTHENATLNNFKNHAPKSTHMHIAAHGRYDPKNPEMFGIELSPNSNDNNHTLRFQDLSSLKMQADLVVLSCCNSGRGRLAPGEGMLAMHKGFVHAGCRNIVFTLFKVPDENTAPLMLGFYENHLLHQQSYGTALRNAKLKMLTQKAWTPKDWAGFVMVSS